MEWMLTFFKVRIVSLRKWILVICNIQSLKIYAQDSMIGFGGVQDKDEEDII